MGLATAPASPGISPPSCTPGPACVARLSDLPVRELSNGWVPSHGGIIDRAHEERADCSRFDVLHLLRQGAAKDSLKQ